MYYDSLEIRDPAERERVLFAGLPAHVQWAQQRCAFYRRTLAGVEPQALEDRAALARLPVTRKRALIELQQREPPFGGINACSPAEIAHVFASPGPIYEPDTGRPDYWRMARALYAAGVRAGQLVHNAFAYHFTPAGFMLESGARALGCPVFPAGTGHSELQARAIAQLRPQVYVGTPSFLEVLLTCGAGLQLDMGSIGNALVSGEALPEELRARLEQRGLRLSQCYATAEAGLIAYESAAREGLILDEAVILEIVRPGSGEPLAAGEVGEVLVTVLNPDYPLIRFATGDLSAVLPGASPCGRTNTRLRGWLGRADQSAKLRGMFVHPEQVAAVAARHPELGRVRLVVGRDEAGRDTMVLHCECAGGGAPDALRQAIVTSIRELCKLRGEAVLVAPGSLPNDGKVIDDTREVAGAAAAPAAGGGAERNGA